MVKECLNCGKEFPKPVNCSLKYWNNERKCCSRKCQAEYRRGNLEYISKLDLSGLAIGHRKGNIHGFVKGLIPWNKGMKGIHLSPHSEFKQGDQTGAKHHQWKGGITPILGRLRQTPEYRLWRKSVLERDGYKCVECRTTEKLQADHIKPFAYYPKLRYELSNGRTLCETCHKNTDTYAAKARLTKLLVN